MSLDNLTVGEANMSDLEAMRQILVVHGTETHAIDGQTDRNRLVHDHFVRKAGKLAIEMRLGSGRYWVARNAHEDVVGMGGYSVSKEQVHSLYVPQAGRGIGSLIFNHMVHQPGVVPNFSAWIADINVGSFAFFASKGVVPTGNTDSWPLGDGSVHNITIHQVAPHGTHPSLATVG